MSSGEAFRESADEASLRLEELQALQAALDPAFLEPLFTRYYPEMVGFCGRRLGNQDDAEDAASEIFHKVMKSIGTFRGGSFRAWIYTIAINTVRDFHRRERLTAPLPLVLQDLAPGPEAVAVAMTEQLEMRRLIASLPVDWQLVVEMRSHGYPSKDVARALGRSDDWVRITHHRAVKRLAGELRGDAFEEGRS